MNTSLKNKSVLITGANGGIGLATWQQVLAQGPKRLALACRGPKQAITCELAIDPVQLKNTKVEVLTDFEMTDAIKLKNAVENLVVGEKFDTVFIQVGGVFFDKRYSFIATQAGKIEKTIFQNAIGGYLLIQYLLERGLLADNARVVFCGGEGARGVKSMIKRHSFHTIENLKAYLEQGPDHAYQTMNAIGVSKLVGALISLKLAEIDSKREYVWFSPGLTGGTKGLNHKPGIGKYISQYLIFPIVTRLGLAQTPKIAAAKCLKALSGEVGRSGDLIGAPEGKALGKLCDQKPMNPDFTNRLLRDDLFNLLEKHFGKFTVS